jgi:signal recognition particle subunit SRP54
MFEILTEKIGKTLRSLSNKGKISEKDIDEALRDIRISLLEADVNFNVVKKLLAQIKEKALSEKVLESLTSAQQIIKIVNIELTSILGKESRQLIASSKPPSLLMLIGLQGSGKTTTAAKLALHLKHTGQRVLLVAADILRPAAIEQLVALGSQIDIPVYREEKTSSAETICKNALRKAREMGYTWVIIDTQGRLHIDEEMMNELIRLKAEVQPVETLLVVDSMTGQEAVKIAHEFNSRIGLTGLILTKTDGDSRGGAALSITYVTGIPVKFIGTGEKSNALEIFYPDRLASRILGMGDMLTLIEKTEKSFDLKKATQLQTKLKKSTFDFEDFLDQLGQIKKMGPLSQIMQLVPGFSKLPANVFNGNEENQLKKIEAIILSMTYDERHNPEILNGSRRSRIARGSGTLPRDVNQLLNQFNQLKKISKMLSKGKLPGYMGGNIK